MGTAAKRTDSASTPDGTAAPSSVDSEKRSTFINDMQRIQSGGLQDDPTESGVPVSNRHPAKNLKGGR